MTLISLSSTLNRGIVNGKTTERREVIRLRLQGKTYSEIKKLVHVSNSSLSLWLHNISLTEKQKKRIKDKKQRTIEIFRESMKLKRELRVNKYYEQQKSNLLPLSEKELLIAGIFLYWGEGGKTNRCTTSINNTDPSVIKFSLYWLVFGLKIPKNRIRVQLHLYKDMDINESLKYWGQELKIPRSQFNKPYIKDSNKTDLDQKGYGHGTCGLAVSNTIIKENLLMAIKVMADYYSQKLEEI